VEERLKEDISINTSKNIAYIKTIMKNSSDVVYREFLIKDWKCALVYIDGMIDKYLLDDYLLRAVMRYEIDIKDVHEIKDRLLTVSDIKEVTDLGEGINAVLSGDTLMFIEGLGSCYVIASRLWPVRGISEPSSETVVRGSRDGFTETIRFNTALVRRRIKDTRLKILPEKLGKRSKTDVAILYIEDIVNKEVLSELMKRIGKINIDAIFDSGYVEQLIEDNIWSPFPQIQSTERPDVVAAALYEGRVAILVDNSPFAIVVPATLPNLFQSPDDYYQRWIYSSVVRIIRFLSVLISLVLPAFYIAITSFHTGIIPTRLAYSIAASREGVPFPAYVEVMIMEFSMAFLTEAIVRLPKAIGATIGIVGGLIIGQAAVSAGIVSPIMIIIVSITVITSFVIPNYQVTTAFRLVRFLIIIAATIAGLYGMMLGLIVLLIHLTRLKSFGIPYLAPAVNTEKGDLKDMFIRFPLRYLKTRPKYMKTGDKIRQKE